MQPRHGSQVGEGGGLDGREGAGAQEKDCNDFVSDADLSEMVNR